MTLASVRPCVPFQSLPAPSATAHAAAPAHRSRCAGVTAGAGEYDHADLVVGADGVNSLVRKTYATDFGERVAPQGCKYVWFGTDHVFDAFTFAFRETEHGLFNAHAYPYDERMSTFIVECPEPVWRAAGLDEDGVAAVALVTNTVIVQEPVRQKLPKTRSAKTASSSSDRKSSQSIRSSLAHFSVFMART